MPPGKHPPGPERSEKGPLRSDSRAEMGGVAGTGSRQEQEQGRRPRQREQHVHRPCGRSRGGQGGWHGGLRWVHWALGLREGFLLLQCEGSSGGR